MNDPYRVLGVPQDASRKAIQSAYRKLAKTCHPDLHPGDARAAQRFIALGDAYAVLSDPAARARYDAGRGETWHPEARAHADFTPPRQPSPEDIERFYRDMRAAYNRSLEPDLDFEKILLVILQSPITYCVLVVFFLLMALKEGLGGLSHTPPP